MDGSDHSRISSSTPIGRYLALKLSSSSTGTNENDQQQGVNLQNSKKLMAKHFMSPTISASSNTIVPTNKILAERNEVSDSNVQNIQTCQNFDNSSNCLSHNGGASLSLDDPLPSYPSPRPKYLRYKPDGRKEILLRCENEAKKREERSSNGEEISLPYKKDIDEKADLVRGAEEGFVKQEGEEIDEEDEDAEEKEQGKEGFLRRVLKLMLIMVVLVFSTLYISSMNSPEASPTLQVMEGFGDGYVKLHNHMYGAIRRLEGENNFFNRMEFKGIVGIFEGVKNFLDRNVGLMKVNQTGTWEWFEEEEIFEEAEVGEIRDNVSEMLAELRVEDIEVEDDSGDMGEKVQKEGGERENVCDHQTAKIGEAFDQMVGNFELNELESIDKLEPVEDNQIPIMSYAFEKENEVVKELVPEVNNVGDGGWGVVESEMSETKKIEDSEVEDDLGDKGEKVEREVGESENACDHLTAKTGEAFDQMVGNFELNEIEGIDKLESVGDNQIPIKSYAFEKENEVVKEPVPEVNNVGDGGSELVESEITETKNIVDEISEVFTSGRTDNEIKSFKILNNEDEESMGGLVEHIKVDTIFKAVIGLVVVLATIAPIVLAFCMKRKSITTKDSFPKINQSGVAGKCNLVLANEREEHVDSASSPIPLISSLAQESKNSFCIKRKNNATKDSVPVINQSGVAEKCNLALANNEGEESMKHVDSAASPISLISSLTQDSKQLNQNHAPSVQLLGEFVVGKMSSGSSFRSARMKSRMEETEVNNYSVSFNKVLSSEAESLVSNHAAEPENVSPSYESFTPQTKKMKKEEARKMVATTPLRRSSRISSKAVKSP